MLWVKRHSSQRGMVLAMADQDLMGRQFEEGDLVLSITAFFKGELVESEAALTDLKGVTVINAVGPVAVNAVLSCGLCHRAAVKRVDGIPHIQVFMLDA